MTAVIVNETTLEFTAGDSSLAVTLSVPAAIDNSLVVWVTALSPAGGGQQYITNIAYDSLVETIGRQGYVSGDCYTFEGWYKKLTDVVTTVTVTTNLPVTSGIVRVLEVSGIPATDTLLPISAGLFNNLNPDTGSMTILPQPARILAAITVHDPTATLSSISTGYVNESDGISGDVTNGVLLNTGSLLANTNPVTQYAATLITAVPWAAIYLAFSPLPPVPAPTVDLYSIYAITVDSAIVTGGADDKGLFYSSGEVSNVQFNMGTDPGILSTIVPTIFPTFTRYSYQSLNLTGLLPGTTYYIQLQASNSLGTTVSNILSFATLQPVPEAPIIRSVVAEDDKVIIAWTPPFSGSPMWYVEIIPYREGVAQSSITNSPDATVMSFPGLTPDVPYTFAIRGVSPSGNGILSAPSLPVTIRSPLPTDIEIGFEVEVWNAQTDLMIAFLEGANNVAFQAQVNQPGSGSFQINKHDPKIQTIPGLLDVGNLIRIRLNGVYAFAFFIEEPANVEDSPAGPGDEIYQPQGRGALAYMERAVVHPPGWVGNSSSSQSAVIPVLDHHYVNWHAAAILLDQINMAKKRGALQVLNVDFGVNYDSAGQPWTDSQTLDLHVGHDLLKLMQNLAPLGVDFNMKYSPPLTLQAFIAPHQIDRSGSVVFRQGRHLGGSDKSTVQKHFSGMRTRMLVEGSGGAVFEWRDLTIEQVPDNIDVDLDFGVREGYYSWGSSNDISPSGTLFKIANAAVIDSEVQSEPLHMAILHDDLPGGYEPFRDYGLGDIVVIDIPGVYDMVHKRIMSMTFSRPPTSGSPLDYKLSIDLGSVYIDPLLKMLAASAFGTPLVGGGIGGPGPIGIPGTPADPCCGGEVLMCEAYTPDPLEDPNDAGGGAGMTVLAIPITVDTPNTRLHIVAHFSLLPASIFVRFWETASIQLMGPDGTERWANLSFMADSVLAGQHAWSNVTIEVPPVAVITESGFVTLTTHCPYPYPYFYKYQVLVYLVTSG